MKKPSERILKLQSLWLHAAKADVSIPCVDKASAVLVRFQLYNAVRAVRKQPELNPELAAAVEVVQVSLRGEGENEVWIGRSHAASALDATFSALGITGQGLATKDALDLAAEESLRKLTGLIGEESAAEPAQAPVHGYPIRNRGTA